MRLDRTSRTFFQHRQAFAPRVWPVILASSVLGGILGGGCGYLFGWYGIAPAVVITGTLSWRATSLIWRRWRQRYPVLNPQQRAAVKREMAPWN